MEIIYREAESRGSFENEWLKARYSFSFSSYQDPEWTTFGQMRVLNHDQVQPGQGFAPHSHADMEIITYVIEGAIEHRDSMGHREVVRSGEVQIMSAGEGVQHSEYNPSPTELLELFQIWVFPEVKGGPPRYGQKHFPRDERRGRLELMVGPVGDDKAPLQVQQQFYLYGGLLEAGQGVQHQPSLDHVWLQVARGSLEVEGRSLKMGDGLGLKFESTSERNKGLSIHASEPAEFVLLET